jgi:hypothetical protein
MKKIIRLTLASLAVFLAALLFHQHAQAGPALRSYADLGNGIISDPATGLMWQKASAPGTHTWDEALSYCANLSLGGFSDWRLPTLAELYALVEKSIPPPGPMINTVYFPATGSSTYWTSSTFAPGADFAFYVDFGYGNVYNRHYKNYKYFVRAVRGGQ